MARLTKKLFTSTGVVAWTVPAGVFRLWVYGTGGGGGGGAGCSGQNANTVLEPAGGGGGGAGQSYGQWLDVTPGQVFNVQCGSGGSPGARSFSFSTAGGDGFNAGGSVVDDGAGTFLVFYGGKGGTGGPLSSGAIGGGRNKDLGSTNCDSFGYMVCQPGVGGLGHIHSATTYGSSRNGQFSGLCSGRLYSAFAGLSGVYPGASGSYKSGGAGGGGGFADWPAITVGGIPGIPGFGGNGGTANAGGNALSTGTTGGTATGYGNGGGGGGGGACASGSGSLGGDGGGGANGAVMFVWVE